MKSLKTTRRQPADITKPGDAKAPAVEKSRETSFGYIHPVALSQSEHMPVAPGTRFGPYEILSLIGAGEMVEVDKGRDSKLHSARLARFDRKAKVLISFNHPNIAHIYGLEGNVLIMELIPGQTLDTALHYAQQSAESLESRS